MPITRDRLGQFSSSGSNKKASKKKDIKAPYHRPSEDVMTAMAKRKAESIKGKKKQNSAQKYWLKPA